jgi:hypothetical protein
MYREGKREKKKKEQQKFFFKRQITKIDLRKNALEKNTLNNFNDDRIFKYSISFLF